MDSRNLRVIAPRTGLFPALGLLFIVAGCSSPDVPAQNLQPPLSDDLKKSAESQVQRFTADVASGKDGDIAKMTTPSMQKTIGPSVNKWLSGPYAPLQGASDWSFDSTENASQGKKVVVRTHYQGKDGKTYRINFTFIQKGQDLLLDQTIPPTHAQAPKTASGGSTAPPGH